MSILTKPSNPISANTEIEMELNVSELLTLVQSLSDSSYWEDISNWRAVDFIFTNDQKQYQRVVFKVNQNETVITYKFNEDCINGLFECSRITVFGNVNDSFRIKRSAYGSQFDVIIEDGVEEVIAIDLTSMSVPLNDTYSDQDILDFTLNFSGLVNVEGLQILTENLEPILLEDGFSVVVGESRLVLAIGSNIRYANYYSGSSTDEIVYRYIVQADDQDLDGLEIVGLDLNGGNIVGVNGEDVNLILPDVDTSGIIINNTVPDTEQPTILSINVPNGTYTNTNEIVFTMTFSEPVSITGSPELVLDVGGVSKVASLTSLSSTQAVFSYTVGSTDNDADGISIISLDDGIIEDAVLNLLDRTLPATDTSNVIVFNDVTAPTITGIQVIDDVYVAGESIVFNVDFSENVVITGAPYLAIDIGGSEVQASLVSNNLNQAVFSYTVQNGQIDLDGISILSLQSGVISDADLNLLDRALPVVDTSNVKVDAVAPTIISVVPPNNSTYRSGQQLNFTVNFSESVTVIGSRLTLVIGSTTRYATYVSGSSTSSILYRYTVQSGDNDTNGISLSSPLDLNGGSITDQAGNNAVLTFTPPNLTNVRVDTTAPIITSVTPPSNGTYTQGQQLNFTVNFSETVNITGIPFLQVFIGSTAKQANYISGTGSSSLLFRYTVASGNLDINGITFASNSIQVPSATVKDVAGNDAVLTFTAPDMTAVLVDAVAPTVTSVTPPANGSYSSGQNLDFTVNFSEIVNVSGTRLTLTIGSTTRYATYVSGSSTASILYRYVIQSGDSDNNGIAISSSVDLNGGSITDQAGNNAVLTFTAPNTTQILVIQDTTAPTITGMTFPNGLYVYGQTLDYQFTFSENVFVVGSPYFRIGIGEGNTLNKNAYYLEGSGTSTITFRYTITQDDEDDYVVFSDYIVLAGDSIKDAAGNNANLYLPATSTAYYNIARIVKEGPMYFMGESSIVGISALGTMNQESTLSEDWVKVSASHNCVLALKSNGRLYGRGKDFMLGIGQNNGTEYNDFIPIGSDKWEEISVGHTHCMGIKQDGSLWSTGLNTYGELGLGHNVDTFVWTQVAHSMSPGTRWGKISCGKNATLAIYHQGLNFLGTGLNNVSNVGFSNAGQLGLGTTTAVNVFTGLSGGLGFANFWTGISLGESHSFALKFDSPTEVNGTKWVTGKNDPFRFGTVNSLASSRNTYGEILNPTGNFNDVSAGGTVSAAITGTNQLLGTGTSTYITGGNTPYWNSIAPSNPPVSAWKSIKCSIDSFFVLNSNGTIYSNGPYDSMANGTVGSTIDMLQIGNDTNWIYISTSFNTRLKAAIKRRTY